MRLLLFIPLIASALPVPIKAQPKIDSVRPGIKSVSNFICGYKGNDSTGLKLWSKSDYNQNGKQTFLVLRPYQTVDANRADDSAVTSWFYLYNLTDEFDTTKYTYDAQGKPTSQYESHGLLTRYVYDAKGKLIMEKSFAAGKLMINTTYTYDPNGKLISAREHWTNENMPKVQNTYHYDSQGRISLEIKKNGSTFDSIAIIYSDTGKTIFSYSTINYNYSDPIRFLHRKTFDKNDSELTNVGYTYNGQRIGYRLQDSLHIRYDVTAKKVIKQSINSTYIYSYDTAHHLTDLFWQDGGYDTLHIEQIYRGDTVQYDNWTYDSNGKLISHLSKDYLFGKRKIEITQYFYNSSGDLAESRLYDKQHHLVQREVYRYEYF